MELTNEQLIKLQRKLGVRKICPNCGSNKTREIVPNQFQLTSTDVSGNLLGVACPITYLPLVAVLCPDCCFTMLFSLKKLGILD